MAAAAPKKTKVDPLPQLHKEAAWAIKWVDDSLYQTLTDPAGDKDEKRAQLIEFFRDQGDESRVVLNETGELNDDGKGILQALVEMSKPAPASRPAGGSGSRVRSRSRPSAAKDEALKGKYAPYAAMLRYLVGNRSVTAEALRNIVHETFFQSEDEDKLKQKKFLALMKDTDNAHLPSFDDQVKLFNAVRKVPLEDDPSADETLAYREALYKVLYMDPMDPTESDKAWNIITENATLPFGLEAFPEKSNTPRYKDKEIDMIALGAKQTYLVRKRLSAKPDVVVKSVQYSFESQPW